jgi:hypothetical protein
LMFLRNTVFFLGEQHTVLWNGMKILWYWNQFSLNYMQYSDILVVIKEFVLAMYFAGSFLYSWNNKDFIFSSCKRWNFISTIYAVCKEHSNTLFRSWITTASMSSKLCSLPCWDTSWWSRQLTSSSMCHDARWLAIQRCGFPMGTCDTLFMIGIWQINGWQWKYHSLPFLTYLHGHAALKC